MNGHKDPKAAASCSSSRIKSNLPAKQKQRIRSRAKITPWSIPPEFDYVGKCLSHATCLFSSDQYQNALKSASEPAAAAVQVMDQDSEAYHELIYGIQRVSTWRSRAENGRLPHSIDVTASMAQIMLQDWQYHSSNTNGTGTSGRTRTRAPYISCTDTNSIKLAYAAILLRAVNGIADSIQRNRASYSHGYGSSVAALCSQIGLPSWIVDLRHDSAHNELPSLVPLRLAARNLLGFFMQQYWTILDDLRLEWRENGVELLKECKVASKAIDRVGMQMKKGQGHAQPANVINANVNASVNVNVSAGEEPKDKEVDGSESEEENWRTSSGNFGAYSIFMDMDKKAKKKAKADKAINANTNTDVDTTPSKHAKVKPHQMIAGRTPRQCLNEYFKTIPIDVGMEMLIQYLFDGGIGDAPEGRGILIPGSPTTFPETMNSVRKIRERYSVILLSVAAKWPGFVHAALARIVDMVIYLDKPEQDEAQEYGRKRKQYFLKHWMFYLLSNEFFCFLQWHDVMWRGSKNVRERPRDKWSEYLVLHMESFAPIDVLNEARLPLNSFCDRFELEGEGESSREIVEFLRRVLGNERKSGVEMKKKCILSGTKRSITGISTSEEIEGSIKKALNDTNNNQEGILDLEEMERMLSDDNIEDQHEEGRKESIASRTKATEISPWTLCHHWDPCAIGSLPGYS